MRLIFVLGMHRSGTSCLTGLLENAGVCLGDVVRSSPHNLKGNNENRRIMKLNGEIMGESGGTWDDPPTGDIRWSDSQEAEARDILQGLLVAGKAAALKDPRCVFTGDGWRRLAGEMGAEVQAIGTFRRPEKVVGSLLARDPKMPENRAYEAWCRYNEKLVAQHALSPFPVVDFDLPAEDYLACVTRAFSEIGLPAPSGELFFTENLRRQGDENAARPESEDLYRTLQGLRS